MDISFYLAIRIVCCLIMFKIMSQHASKTGSVVIADVLETIRQNHLQILWTEVLMSG